jgi:hypothetical protein
MCHIVIRACALSQGSLSTTPQPTWLRVGLRQTFCGFRGHPDIAPEQGGKTTLLPPSHALGGHGRGVISSCSAPRAAARLRCAPAGLAGLIYTAPLGQKNAALRADKFDLGGSVGLRPRIPDPEHGHDKVRTAGGTPAHLAGEDACATWRRRPRLRVRAASRGTTRGPSDFANGPVGASFLGKRAMHGSGGGERLKLVKVA